MIEPPLLAQIRRLVSDLAAGRYDDIERDGRAGRVGAADLETAVRDYGRQLLPLPDDAAALIRVYPHLHDPKSCALDVDLWSREEGRSDLTLQLTATKLGDEWQLSIDDLHVL